MIKLTSINWSECDKEDAMPFERNNPLSAVLEIGKFDTTGSTHGSTDGSTPACSPPSEFSPVSFLAHCNNPS